MTNDNMNIVEIIDYLKKHPENIHDICREFKLHVDFHNKEEIMEHYEYLKNIRDRFKERYQKDREKWSERYHDLVDEVEQFEKLYHIFEPEFNMEEELTWIPKDHNKEAQKVFEYRKEIYYTQSIYEDMLLDRIISSDESETWDNKGGQDGMYESFPFTISYKSEVGKRDYVNPHYKEEDPFNNTKVYHYTTEMIRSYCLNGSGGIVIVETITHTKHDDNPKDYTNSRFQILTLGEDDGNHFLNSRRIYEEIYEGTDKDFLDMLSMVIKEYRNFKDSEN